MAGRGRRCWALTENWCAPTESPPHPFFHLGASAGKSWPCSPFVPLGVFRDTSRLRGSSTPLRLPITWLLANSYPFLKTAFWHHLNKTLTPPFRPNSSFSPLYIKNPFIVETFSKGTSRILLHNFCTLLPLLYYPRGKGVSRCVCLARRDPGRAQDPAQSGRAMLLRWNRNYHLVPRTYFTGEEPRPRFAQGVIAVCPFDYWKGSGAVTVPRWPRSGPLTDAGLRPRAVPAAPPCARSSYRCHLAGPAPPGLRKGKWQRRPGTNHWRPGHGCDGWRRAAGARGHTATPTFRQPESRLLGWGRGDARG